MNKDNAKDYLPLVQALVEGKVIQWRSHAGNWEDSRELSDAWGAENYRIKPEPKEIWINFYDSGYIGKPHSTQSEAYDARDGKVVTKHFREVIE